MRTVTAILILLVLIATGCEYDAPLAVKQGLPVDERVFGLWEKIERNGKPKPEHRIAISGVSGTEYLIRDSSEQGESYFRGYEIKVAGVSCIQIQDISKKESGKYYVLSYEFLGGDLVIKTLNPKLVNSNLKYSSQLNAAFLRHKDDQGLFVDLSRFSRVKSNESKLGNLETDLLIASRKGVVAIVRTLLAKGADVNAKDRYSNSALMFASHEGHVTVVRALLANGADVNANDDNGDTALIWAARKGRLQIVQILLARGAHVNVRNSKGYSALILAAQHGDTAVVQALLAKGADVNAKTIAAYTALIWAAYEGHLPVVKALLAKGADVNAKDSNGNSALVLASAQGHSDVVRILQQAQNKSWP